MNEPGQKKPFWKRPRLPRLTWKRAVLTAAGLLVVLPVARVVIGGIGGGAVDVTGQGGGLATSSSPTQRRTAEIDGQNIPANQRPSRPGALARLVEPLDAARGRLHHDEDLRFKRAGLHAAEIILGNCRGTGPFLVVLDRLGLGQAGRLQQSSLPLRSGVAHRPRCVRSCWDLPLCSAGSPTTSMWATSTDCTWRS